MRTTIEVSENVVSEIIKYYNVKTKTEAVNKALVDWVNHLKKQQLLQLRGMIDISDNINELKRIEIEEMKKYE